MRTIPLTQGKVAIVDDEDYDFLMQWKWNARRCCKDSFYAKRHQKEGNGRVVRYMHQEVSKPPKGMEVDHINHNGLDNRRENLRVCTHQENAMNNSGRNGCSSNYVGVCWKPARRKWQAQIKHNGIVTSLGFFRYERDAAIVRDRKAKELRGDFAYLNFPNPI